MTDNLPTTAPAIKPIAIPDDVLTEMQTVIDQCVPATTKAVQTLQDSLVIANGLNALKTFFQNEQVKLLVETMQDTTLGFLTDRKPEDLKRQNAKKPPQYKKSPYSYEEITEALIPPMLEGYRFTGNEINIINGKGMPVKNGKHRKIMDLVEGFSHVVGGPIKENGVAKMKCQARWVTKEGTQQSIGYEGDPCIIHVEFDSYSGIDKLIGLAESKLFSRVLTRISGRLVIEGDVPVEDSPEIEAKPTAKGKNLLNMDTMEKPVSYVEKLATVVDDVEYKEAIEEALKAGEIDRPNDKKNDLRTTDEATAEKAFGIIEKYKDFIDSSKSD